MTMTTKPTRISEVTAAIEGAALDFAREVEKRPGGTEGVAALDAIGGVLGQLGVGLLGMAIGFARNRGITEQQICAAVEYHFQPVFERSPGEWPAMADALGPFGAMVFAMAIRRARNGGVPRDVIERGIWLLAGAVEGAQ